MLRRKLLKILGSLVVLLAIVAAVAIWQLQAVLERIDHINKQAMSMVEDVNHLGGQLTEIEIELYELELGRKRSLDRLIGLVDQMQTTAARLGEHYIVHDGKARDIYHGMEEDLPLFTAQVGSLATTRDPGLAKFHNREALKISIRLRRDILQLGDIVREHVRAEQDDMAARFRWLVLGLGLVFLLVINLAIVMMWRVASMILRPVDELVTASRRLSREDFTARLELNQRDEFDELGQAFNHLAEQLQANERRRLEMLQQVARTLNHELNNATATIELQLTLLKQRSNDGEATRKCLRQIRDNLDRMTRTVQSLKNIRRVVLTDYTAGEKMLDLEQSTQDDAAGSEPPAQPR